jgi:hypothetical protein
MNAPVRVRPGGIESIRSVDDAVPGERMHFVAGVDDPRDVLTGPLKEIGRPPRDVIAQYDS